MNLDVYWMSKGRYGGRFVQSAWERLSSVTTAKSISIDVLDAVVNDDRLVSSLEFKALIADLKLERFGPEWSEERKAIATQTVDDFRSAWHRMHKHLLENHLVAVVSSLENYVMSLLVEFPPPVNRQISDPASSDQEIESDWQKADSLYKKAVKEKKSASGAWVKLCTQSSIPEDIKISVINWGNFAVHTRTVDEMVLIRNSIVHRAGVMGDNLASHLSPDKVSLGKTVTVSQESLKRFGDSYWYFILAIEPAL